MRDLVSTYSRAPLAPYPAASMHTASEEAVGQSGTNIGQFALPDSAVVAERVNRFLRARYSRDTAKLVAGDTGLPVGTIAKWLTRSSAPSLPACVTLIAAYGPDLLSALCPDLPWVHTIVKLTRRETLHRQLDALEAEGRRVVEQLASPR